MNRRKFIKRSLLGIGTAGILSGLYAWQIEPFWVDFVKINMPLKNLPNALNGKTLMQISDIHVGNNFNHKYIIESFTKAKTYNPDIVVYTGDYVSLHNGEVQQQKLDEVLQNVVKGSLATIGILGNHDYGNNWKEMHVADKISNNLNENGVIVLRNQSVDINGLNVIGFDDYWGLNFNGEEAMKNYDAIKANIVLCHNPDVCDLDVWKNYEGWILSGHTHGGQVKAPFLPPFIIPVKNKKYTSGKIDLSDKRTLYINRALGHLWQIRFLARPEITIFTLQKAD